MNDDNFKDNLNKKLQLEFEDSLNKLDAIQRDDFNDFGNNCYGSYLYGNHPTDVDTC